MSNFQMPSEYKHFPASWKVLPFNEAIKDVTGGNPKVKGSDYLDQGPLAVVDQGQSNIAGYVDDLSLACKAPLPSIVFGDHTKALKFIEHPFALGADGVKILEPIGGLDKRFVFHYLNQLTLPDNAGYSRHYKFLKEKFIPLPPLPEQRRIAAILDKAAAIRRKRQEAIRLTEEFLRSVFLDMFGDPVTNPKGWEVVQLGEVCDFTAGNSLPAGETYSEQEGGHLLLKVGDMNLPGNEIFISTAREWTDTYRGRMVAPKGAIILPKRGGAISTNKKRILGRPALLDPNLMGIYSPKGQINPYCLFQWFQGFDLNEISSGSAVPQLNKQDLAPLKIALPPIDLQKKFERIVKKLFAMKDLQGHDGFDELFNSLVQRAFQGDL